MKLSNKILIGFFGFVFVYMTLAFTEIRFRGDLHRFDEDNGISETADISNIGFVQIQDLDQQVVVAGADQPKIEIRSSAGQVLKNLKYEIQGDTLSLQEFALTDDIEARITIYVSDKQLRGLNVTDTRVTLRTLELEDLSITQNGGQIWFGKKNNLSKISMSTKSDAKVYIYTPLDELNVTASNSEIVMQENLKRLSGTLSSRSLLVANGMDEVQLKKDESSRIQLY